VNRRTWDSPRYRHGGQLTFCYLIIEKKEKVKNVELKREEEKEKERKKGKERNMKESGKEEKNKGKEKRKGE
jgi:hypothetical protein